eukprot:5806610-Amphidinium_carterae.4
MDAVAAHYGLPAGYGTCEGGANLTSTDALLSVAFKMASLPPARTLVATQMITKTRMWISNSLHHRRSSRTASFNSVAEAEQCSGDS